MVEKYQSYFNSLLFILILHLLLCPLQTSADDLFISIPQDQLNLTLRSTATILCNPSQGMVAWEKNGVPLQSELDARITVNRNLTIMNVTFADIGVYTCLVAVGDREYNMSARLSIQGRVGI